MSQVFAAPELTGTWPIPITSISPGGNFGIKIFTKFSSVLNKVIRSREGGYPLAVTGGMIDGRRRECPPDSRT